MYSRLFEGTRKRQGTQKRTRIFCHKCKSFLILFQKERLPLVYKSSTSARSKTAHTHFFYFLPYFFLFHYLFFFVLKSIEHIHFKQSKAKKICEKKWMTEPQRFDFYNFFFLVCLFPLSYTPKYNIKRTIFLFEFLLHFFYSTTMTTTLLFFRDFNNLTIPERLTVLSSYSPYTHFLVTVEKRYFKMAKIKEI